MSLRVLLLVLLGVSGCPLPGRAQPQAYNWRFGSYAGLTFPGGGPPVASPPTTALADEGCASISDEAGGLQCYTNGVQVWDRTNALMPNGNLVGSHISATQAALLLPDPGQPGRYHLFTVDAYEHNFVGGLRHSQVNMTLRGGLGDVEAPNSVPVPVPKGALVAEKLTAVRHANGRDYWVVVHHLQNNLFFCYLLTPSGLVAVPVVSQAGRTYGRFDGLGYLRASPNGQLLAACELEAGLELFDFDNATGSVTLRQTWANPSLGLHYGVEFSPDNTKLYASIGTTLYQLDLAGGGGLLNLGGAGAQALQRGPDGRLYVAHDQRPGLSVVEFPNRAGAACTLRANAIVLPTGVSGNGLPNFPNDFAPVLAASIPATWCVSSLLGVAVAAAPAGLSYSWDFGDSSPAVAGAAASHRYAQAGTYLVTLTATPQAGGPVQVVRQAIVISSPPTLSLGNARQTFCAGQALLLGPVGGPQPGFDYRWQDGTTGAVRQVQAAGRYVLTATTPAGCRARDSVDVTVLPALQLRLLPPVPLCPGAGSVLLQANAQPPGTTYRWQDGTTTATYAATRPGRYRLEVRAPTSCPATDSVDVRLPLVDGECEAVFVPNILLPASPGPNSCFATRGLLPDWDLVVYSRWGREVYRRAGYDNSWAAEGQPAGLYYYLFSNPRTGRHLRGWVEVVR